MSKKISYHIRKKTFQISKYLAFGALISCLCISVLVWLIKVEYVGEWTPLYTASGICADAYYTDSRGKRFTSLLTLVIDDERYVVSQLQLSRFIDDRIPDYINPKDFFIEKKLEIKYTIDGKTLSVQSIASDDGYVFLDLDETRSLNFPYTVGLGVIFAVVIIITGVFCVGASIETIKAPPTFKQLLKWHKNRKKREQEKEEKLKR